MGNNTEAELLNRLDKNRMPCHVAIVMDGNGRWATAKGLERCEGHKAGVHAVDTTVEAALNCSIKYLTLYAFSTENWNRPPDEVQGLMDLAVIAVNSFQEKLINHGVKVQIIGDMARVPQDSRMALEACVAKTAKCDKMTIILAISYSSRWEITEATRQIARQVKTGEINEADIKEELINRNLSTCGIPDPDLLIRTGGEKRISNFLLWQCAYSEFYFTNILWPDFTKDDFYAALWDYQTRERRFGMTSGQISQMIKKNLK